MPQAAAPSIQRHQPTAADLSGGLQFEAPLELKAAADGALPAHFSGTAYSGGFVPDYEMVIDLASTTYKPRMALLDSHNRREIVGVIEQASTDKGAMSVAGRIFSDMAGSAAERIAQLASRGVPYEMSVGLYGFTREFVPAGKSVQVNGQTFNGPVNVLRNGQVREVSIVTLGADPRTDSKFFEQPTGDASMPQTVEQLSAQVAELTAQVAGHAAALSAARDDAARAERERIQAVHAQALPGFDKLIVELMFDGKSTAGDAAIAINAAQRVQLSAAAANLAADAPKPAAAAATPAVEAQASAAQDDPNTPVEDRCRAKWDGSAEIRAEFGSLAAFTAFTRAAERGSARIFNARKES
jgi:hypothetical protein